MHSAFRALPVLPVAFALIRFLLLAPLACGLLTAALLRRFRAVPCFFLYCSGYCLPQKIVSQTAGNLVPITGPRAVKRNIPQELRSRQVKGFTHFQLQERAAITGRPIVY
jgi:hypothetical protein